ncbi:hypothetical protein [Henriciella aquimarina]|uniref:hypothetical protein n=1 Tax=Henriciella aquimarina TaxID=545261 RepID=UPI000A036A9C|nr:hypothetical protein [Henriciella aquimarina]
MTVINIKQSDALDMVDGIHEAASLIDGMITCAEAMQDELWARIKHAGQAGTSEGFNEALTCTFSMMRSQVAALKALAD